MTKRSYSRGSCRGPQGSGVTFRSIDLDHDIKEIERGNKPNPLLSDEKRLKDDRSKVTLSSSLDAWLKKEIPE